MPPPSCGLIPSSVHDEMAKDVTAASRIENKIFFMVLDFNELVLFYLSIVQRL